MAFRSPSVSNVYYYYEPYRGGLGWNMLENSRIVIVIRCLRFFLRTLLQGT
jgi:hypothetical protein